MIYPTPPSVSTPRHYVLPFSLNVTTTSSYILPPMFQVALPSGLYVVQLNIPPQASINCVALIVHDDANWYPDSGATNHLTNASLIPQLTTTYTGSGKVLAGNGSSLNISAISSSVIHTQSKQLMLNNMLYTPNVTNNLLSVS